MIDNNVGVLLKLHYFLATGFGIGKMSNLFPVGTVASLAAIPIWWILRFFFLLKYIAYF